MFLTSISFSNLLPMKPHFAFLYGLLTITALSAQRPAVSSGKIDRVIDRSKKDRALPRGRHLEWRRHAPPRLLSSKAFRWINANGKRSDHSRTTGKGRTTAIFQPVSDNYLKFLVQELKPYIDQHYSTRADATHTAIAGSSMGGLISLYAICEYPNVFGKAAGLSTHWPGTFSVDGNPFIPAMRRYLQENLPDPKTHRIYLDGGDQELDALYPPLLKAVESILRQRGYTDSTGRSRIIAGAGHSEKAWSARLGEVLAYLLR